MGTKNELLRQIPKVDELLRWPKLAAMYEWASPTLITQAVRGVLQGLRDDISQGRVTAVPDMESLAGQSVDRYKREMRPNLMPVINGTGVVLHTNLGRAPLAREALELVEQAAGGYSNLEYDVSSGSRGSRHSHVQQLLVQLTGAQAAMVVNNNAAAVMLILSEMAGGREVIVSRGELVEIGGSFRVPDVMSQSGCVLREVGTTNKTHLEDYENAIRPDITGALMKIHASNYKIVGFAESVSAQELVALGKVHGLPVIEDLGSGCLFPLRSHQIGEEPTVSESIAAGIDVLSFSGDKLLGGPQAGIIVGSAQYIERMKRHPLARALRIDKLTLAALEGTLRLYLDPEKVKNKIPIIRMLTESEEVLRNKAERLCALIGEAASVSAEYSQVGGGSLPAQMLPTYVVVIKTDRVSAMGLEEKLRGEKVPIVGRISHDQYLLDVRTIEDEDFPYVAGRVCEAVGGGLPG